MRSHSKQLMRAIVVLALAALCIVANVFEVAARNESIPLNVLNINKTLLFNRVNATVNSAFNTQPSLQGALATASGKIGSARAAKNATKNLARSYWLLNRTVAYNPTNKTQLTALADYTYGRLQFESLLKQGYAFTVEPAVPSGGSGAVATASNMTCFFDPLTGTVTNLQQSSKLACTAGGQRVVIPTAGKYVTKVEMAVDKELPLVGRFVFHVRDTLDSKPRVYTCGFAGGEAISLFPPGYIATSIDVGCIPLTPQAIGKKRKLMSQVAKNAANPELVTAVVVSESIVREQSPDKPVSVAVVATGVVQGSTFAVSPSSLSPAVENQIENANNQSTTCPSETPDICSVVGGGNICVSLATDRNRCGSCSNVCPAAQSCVSGACSCPAAIPDLCGSACVNKATDAANCGACGNACPAAQSCVSGACSCPAAIPDLCGSACVNFASDSANCGSCGNACPAGSTCNSGECCFAGDMCKINAACLLYSQDFSQDASGWINYGDGSVVQSSSFTPKFRTNVGVGQVQMADGTFGPYTRFRPDGSPPFFTDFSAASPNGFAAELAIYFNLADDNGIVNDKRFDYSVALNTKNTSFVQDFFFNVGFYDDNNGPGAGQRRVVASVSNNAPGWPKNPDRDPVAITTSGWYIFQHKVYPVSGQIYVDLSIFSADCNQLIHKWTLQAFVNGNVATPLTVANAGYLRYGWFYINQWPSLAVTLAAQKFGVIRA